MVVADVSGKGLPAALLMPAVKIALRTLAERQTSTRELLGELNRVFLDNLPPASYFTLVYAVFDAAAGRLVYANAGHLPALHLKARAARRRGSGRRDRRCGLLHEDVQFDTVDVRFGPGDVFVFYTDGITEAEDPGGADSGANVSAATVRAVRRPAGGGWSWPRSTARSMRSGAPRPAATTRRSSSSAFPSASSPSPPARSLPRICRPLGWMEVNRTGLGRRAPGGHVPRGPGALSFVGAGG